MDENVKSTFYEEEINESLTTISTAGLTADELSNSVNNFRDNIINKKDNYNSKYYKDLLNKEDIKINILGTEWKIKITDPEYKKFKSLNATGLCEVHSKEILIANLKEDDKTYDNYKRFIDEIFKHEIIHAFFYESGLKQYYYDETLVEALSILIPKMNKVFKELNLIE